MVHKLCSCRKSTREIVVEDENYHIYIFFLLAWVLIGISFWKEDKWLGFMAGAFVLILGIFALIYGFGGLNDWYTRSIGWVHIGAGLILVIMAGLRILEDHGG